MKRGIVIGLVFISVLLAQNIFTSRMDFTSVTFEKKLWVIGGTTQEASQNDVWSSVDGINWIQVTSDAGWLPRENHASVVFDNKIWVLGGVIWSESQGKYVRVNDVWCSEDGVNWTQVTAGAQWEGREGHAVVVFGNKMWVLGGDRFLDDQNDIWCSSDGVNWDCVTEHAQWVPRSGHTAVVFDNKIWVLGGYRHFGQTDGKIFNDVWYSSDGINWTQATANAKWSAREEHTSVVFNNKIWVIGGKYLEWLGEFKYVDNQYEDIWFSTDGIKWIKAADLPERSGHTSVIFNNKMWVMGGWVVEALASGRKNDIWYSLDGRDWICTTDSSKIEILRSKYPDWSPETYIKVLREKICIGMTREQVIASWGRPDDINRTVGSFGVHEQWIYKEGKKYLYFENGVLTSWQD